jgi:hypothetical protein
LRLDQAMRRPFESVELGARSGTLLAPSGFQPGFTGLFPTLLSPRHLFLELDIFPNPGLDLDAGVQGPAARVADFHLVVVNRKHDVLAGPITIGFAYFEWMRHTFSLSGYPGRIDAGQPPTWRAGK